jgi:hypothetical protein
LENLKPDTSRATKSGHLHVLTTLYYATVSVAREVSG